jgi:hypothetical protein
MKIKPCSSSIAYEPNNGRAGYLVRKKLKLPTQLVLTRITETKLATEAAYLQADQLRM